MVDEELLKRLKALGVKRVRMLWVSESVSHVEEVEFFPEPALSFDATDDEPAAGEGEPVVAVPPALARIIRKGSVS